MSTHEEATFRFGPLDRGGGVLFGLTVVEFCVIATGALVGLSMLKHPGGILGLFLFAGAFAAAVAAAKTPIRGRALLEWTPLTISFLVARARKQTRFRAQLHAVGHVVGVPEGGLTPEPFDEPRSLPAELADLVFLEGTLNEFASSDGQVAPLFGVVKDKRANLYTAVLRCQGRAFALLSPEEREDRLAEYAGVLKALADDDPIIRRVQWVERTLPPDGDALVRYLLDHGKGTAALLRPDDVSAPLAPAVESYARLTQSAGDVTQDHELLFAVTIDAGGGAGRRAAKAQAAGGSFDLGAMAVLASQIGRVYQLLNGAGIQVQLPLDRRAVATVIRNAYDPFEAKDRARTAGGEPAGVPAALAGPLARNEYWDRIETDGAVHATYWISEWPRLDVRALFLEPLLMNTTLTRTVSMTMEVVGQGKAARRVETTATAVASHQTMRDRVGQRTSHRQARDEAAVAQREAELAEGHADVRFTAFVSVAMPRGSERPLNEPRSEAEANDFRRVTSELVSEVKRSMLKAEPMFGQQAEAFTYVLPLGRGLK